MSTNRAWLRPGLYLVALALLSVSLIAVTAGPARAATRVHHPDTTVTVLRPVTATGHAAHGWKVVTDSRPAISCDEASYVTTDRGIDFCGSSADYTEACWKSASKGRVLCLGPDDARRRVLRSVKLHGTFANATPVSHAQPILLSMRNGMTMAARDGGAWSFCGEHRNWFGFYAQIGGNHTIYAPRSNPSGLNQDHGGWFGTVFLHPETDKGYHAWVATAYFLGTAR